MIQNGAGDLNPKEYLNNIMHIHFYKRFLDLAKYGITILSFVLLSACSTFSVSNDVPLESLGELRWDSLPVTISSTYRDDVSTGEVIEFLNNEFGAEVFVIDNDWPKIWFGEDLPMAWSEEDVAEGRHIVGLSTKHFRDSIISDCMVQIQESFDGIYGARPESVLAHELMHCLGVSGHTEDGLMAPVNVMYMPMNDRYMPEEIKDWFDLVYHEYSN